MIPKVIHCCWFGGEKTALARKCRSSWGVFAPGWQVREWSESSAAQLEGLPGYGFFESALRSGKWAMASDWLRMAALALEGGVYLDFDVELVGEIDSLCERGEWVAGELTAAGDEWPNPGGGIALGKGSAIALRMLESYAAAKFDPDREMMPFITASLADAVRFGGEPLRVLPPEVMSPIDQRGVCRRTAATRAIHHYAMSWAGPKRRLARFLSWHGMRAAVEFALRLGRQLRLRS